VIERGKYLARLAVATQRAPVTALLGPRQCGKTTLARSFAAGWAATHFDLRSQANLRRLQNPELALGTATGLVVLDENQVRPELFGVLRVLIHRPARRARFLVLRSASPPRSRIWGWTTSGSSIRASRSFEWRRGSRAGRCATSRRWPIKSSRLPAAERALHLGEPADWQDARQSVSTCPPRSPGRRAGRQRKEDCDNRLRRVARYSQGQPAVVTGCWVGLRGLGNGRQTSAARRVPLYCSIENRRLNCATDTMRVCSRRLASSKSWSPVTRKSAWAASAHAMNLASLLSRGNRNYFCTCHPCEFGTLHDM